MQKIFQLILDWKIMLDANLDDASLYVLSALRFG